MNRIQTLRTTGWFLAALLLPGVLGAAEPTREELLNEIVALRERLASLEAIVLAEPAEPVPEAPVASPPSAPAAPPQPAPEPVKPAAPILKFYGFAKIDAVYETADTFVDGIAFWVQPQGGANNSDGDFSLSAKETRFGVDIRGPELGDGTLGGKLEFDFYGNLALSNRHAYTPRSRHAYVQWASDDWTLLAGETWETYLVAFPKSVNFAYYNLQGQLGLRRTQLRVSRQFEVGNGEFGAHFALADPLGGLHGADLDGDGQDDGADADMPHLQTKLQYRGDWGDIAIAGFYGREHAVCILSGQPKNFDTWGVVVGGQVKLGASLSLRGTIWTGTNLDSAWGGIGQGINQGLSRTIDAQGGWIQLGWAATDALSLNIGFSRDDPQDDDLSTGQRSFNETAVINGFYKVGPHLTLGLELLGLRTGYKDMDTATSKRVQSSVKYTF